MKKLTFKFKKLLSILLIVQLLLVSLAPVSVLAEEAVAEPTPAETTTASSNESTTTITATDTSSSAIVSPSPSAPMTDEEEEAAEREALLQRRAEEEAARQARREAEAAAAAASSTTTGGASGGDTVGTGSTVTTGDATATGAVMTAANTNLSGSAGITGGTSGAQVVNSENGSSSTNTGTVAVDNNSATVQDNDANVSSSLIMGATSGDNRNSDNIGGNVLTKTGDANVTGTVITAVNTNVDGVMVSEFNIADDHTGDILLDFGAGCISGCAGGPTSVANTGNLSSSTNTGSIDQTNNNTTTQNNDAVIGSELVLNADSGGNRSNDNIQADTRIETGDANVAGNVLTFANTNVAGSVIYAVVNIFGDLVGDIILTEDAINNCCGGTSLSASNTGNGADSTNTAAIDLENNDTILQTNDAVIDNNLTLDAQTGNNTASDNGGGNVSIETGSVDITANLLNIINTNLVGGNMWLVLVNEAGNWVGKLLGAPDGASFTASSNADFTIDENGYITVTNSENGADSTNSGSVSQTNNNTTTQTNTAVVGNTLNLSANTGGNTASDNIGGNTSIKTGDATIIANLVNFVNTNIVGSGKLVVTVVNVFESWLGDFVTPGSAKQDNIQQNPPQDVAVGGSPNPQQNNNKSNQNIDITSRQNTSTTGGAILVGAQEVADQMGRIFAAQGTSQGTLSSSTDNEGASKVAGASTNNSGKKIASAKNKITINLAWLVMIIPLLSLTFIGRKIVVRKLSTK